ncbi:hypothetical protein RHMOL_Rhmol08G0030200 [Rhododendron molle]|uniref:Uncharacterized protein n=1 Tax=Rhododendron molle TaxID=49168 RepID=A0ACC0MJ64_RHOML|nr:hypothetical protein RHMOL_Rhmol08G0030200 [Rhododendron molle]
MLIRGFIEYRAIGVRYSPSERSCHKMDRPCEGIHVGPLASNWGLGMSDNDDDEDGMIGPPASEEEDGEMIGLPRQRDSDVEEDSDEDGEMIGPPRLRDSDVEEDSDGEGEGRFRYLSVMRLSSRVTLTLFQLLPLIIRDLECFLVVMTIQFVIEPKFARPGRVPVTTCASDREGKSVAGGIGDGSIQIWNLKPGWGSRPDIYVEKGHSDDITGLKFSSDGQILLSRSFDESLKVWDLRKMKDPLKVFEDLPSHYGQTNVAFSPDEQLFSTGTSVEREGTTGGPGHGGRVGSTKGSLLTQYLLKQGGLIKETWMNEDPREAILKHTDVAAKDPKFIAPAYAQTQPEPVSAKSDSEDEEK